MEYLITTRHAPEKVYIQRVENIGKMSLDDFDDWDDKNYYPVSMPVAITIEAENGEDAGRIFVQRLLNKGGKYVRLVDEFGCEDDNYILIGSEAWGDFTVHHHHQIDENRWCSVGYHLYQFMNEVER